MHRIRAPQHEWKEAEEKMNMIDTVKKQIIQGRAITQDDARILLTIEEPGEMKQLEAAARDIMKHFSGTQADLCALINAKSGACSEDCAYCAQSGHYNTAVNEYPLVDVETILARAQEAARIGAHRFCIVTSGCSLTDEEFEHILAAYAKIKKSTTLEIDGSLGLVSDERIERLKAVGVTKYNHNLETSERFFPKICTTHSWRDRYNTILCLKKQGMAVCAGGIIGMGETPEDRLSLAFSLCELDVDGVPINILNPRAGTPLENENKLSVDEIIKTIAVFRFILPRQVIKIAGGREVNLGKAQERALRAGANGIIIGGYLTTQGNTVEKDKKLIKEAGLKL